MKRLLLLSALTLMLSDVAFNQTVVLSGNWGASSETKSYTLNQNTGYRTITIEIFFLKPFKVKPNVVVGISSIDVDKSAPVRYAVKPISVSRDGFTVEVNTWGDTKINSVTGFWVAHAE
ncbi:MAG: H-type lectin domain-containing protein [Ignavibacteria bacterium]|nr:H-type lectin domain-containing protein [Ignavibacteria bacterium]